MGSLHDALKASGYKGHDLEQFLVRVLFCLFADATGIFERGTFAALIEDRTREDGSDLGRWLAQLFDVLNTPEEEREQNLDGDLKEFRYINGDLFKERLRIPSFDTAMRGLLLEACGFSWEAVSPAIFGSLFQYVMGGSKERRSSGRALHNREEHSQSHSTAVSRRPALRARPVDSTAGHGPA